MRFLKVVFIILGVVFLSPKMYGNKFTQLLQSVNDHPKVLELKQKQSFFLEKSNENSVLKDPVLKLSLQNLPLNTLKLDQSPMSAVEVSISQSFPVNGKLENLETAFRQRAEAKRLESDYMVRKLKLEAWKNALAWKHTKIEESYVDENILWLGKQLKIANSRFSTGKAAQQSVIEIEIRIANLQAKKASLQAEEVTAKRRLAYILGLEGTQSLREIDPKSLRVESLIPDKQKISQPMLESIRSVVKAEESMAKAFKQAKTPELTVGVSYKQRSNIDSLGDFIGVFVSAPLTVGDKTANQHRASLANHRSQEQALIYLEQERDTVIRTIEEQLKYLEQEKYILKQKSLKLSKLVRDAASKAYGISSGSYNSLLSAEINYLETRIRINRINQKIANHKIELTFARGERLS